MSRKKQVIELEPEGIGKEELFSLHPVRCASCAGRGYFTEEVDRYEVKETPCSYCEGKGRIYATVYVCWQPYAGEKDVINNLKEFYHEMDKRKVGRGDGARTAQSI